MNAKAKKVKLRKARTAFWINLSICILSLILGIDCINNPVLWKIISCAIIFVISMNIAILIFQELIRLQKAEE